MANDFSGDSDVHAVYNFENGATTTDSSGNGNTLTEDNTPTSDTTNYKQGAGSIHYTENSNESSEVADASLSAGFPVKSSGGSDDFSLTCWMRATDDDDLAYVISKYRVATNGRSFALQLDNNAGGSTGTARALHTIHGYNSGNSFESGVIHAGSLTVGQWYWVQFSYDSATKTHRLRVWDDTGADWLGSTASNALSNAMYHCAEPWSIGDRVDHPGNRAYDGNIDELVFWSRVISDADGLAVKNGTYTSGTDTDVTATLEALTLTEYDAVVSIGANTNVSAGIESLTLTEYDAVVSIGANTNVSAGIESLTLTEYPATVAVPFPVAVSVEGLTLTEYNAVVSIGANISVSAGSESLTLTEYNPTIIVPMPVAVGVQELILTEYKATITHGAPAESVILSGVDIISGDYMIIYGQLKTL